MSIECKIIMKSHLINLLLLFYHKFLAISKFNPPQNWVPECSPSLYKPMILVSWWVQNPRIFWRGKTHSLLFSEKNQDTIDYLAVEITSDSNPGPHDHKWKSYNDRGDRNSNIDESGWEFGGDLGGGVGGVIEEGRGGRKWEQLKIKYPHQEIVHISCVCGGGGHIYIYIYIYIYI